MSRVSPGFPVEHSSHLAMGKAPGWLHDRDPGHCAHAGSLPVTHVVPGQELAVPAGVGP